MSPESIQKFIEKFAESLEQETFVKLTLGNYKGVDASLQKIAIRLIETKRGSKLLFLYRAKTRDTTKNYDFAEGAKIISELLGKEFFAGHLFTTEKDFQLDVGKKSARLSIGEPTFKMQLTTEHNREKHFLIDPKSFYLQALGVTHESGEIRAKQADKWRQINKFVEIIEKLFDESELKNKSQISIVDMGSGKGYLTFAVYEYFNNVRKIQARVTGIEARDELVFLCNDIAETCEFRNLKFEKGFINDFEIEEADVLIALHACNTATDEAIFKGISAKANLIIAAPCCHQEIRPQIKAPEIFKNILKHGSLLEREAETITDGLRALLLEREGYATKVFEFIASEHTPKNNMIVGTKKNKKIEAEKLTEQIADVKIFYGIREQRLEKLLLSGARKNTL